MSAAQEIRLFVKGLAPGQIFTTSQVLHFGTRNAVDLALSRLVKCQILKRLAQGVFVLRSPCSGALSAVDVAFAKASAFGKRIYIEQSGSPPLFLTNGASTSFSSVFGRISFKFTGARKFVQRVPHEAFCLLKHLVNLFWNLCQTPDFSISTAFIDHP